MASWTSSAVLNSLQISIPDLEEALGMLPEDSNIWRGAAILKRSVLYAHRFRKGILKVDH